MGSITSNYRMSLAPRRPALKVKEYIQHAVAGAHMKWSMRDLPDALAIYFHELEPWQLRRMDELLGYFLDAGYQTVDACDYAMAAPGQKVLFLSFDDCFRRWHGALDLFARHGVTATFYVNSMPLRDVADRAAIAEYFTRIDYAGDDRTLSTEEVRELHDAGHTIGCHSHSHQVLSALPRNSWSREIGDSKARLEQIIDAPVLDFSFPYGKRRHFSSVLRDYCRSVGFRSVASGLSGMQFMPRDDPFSLHRTGWNFALSLEANIRRLSTHAPLYGRMLGRCAVG